MGLLVLTGLRLKTPEGVAGDPPAAVQRSKAWCGAGLRVARAGALRGRLALAFSLGALGRLPPVPVVAVTDVALVHLHFDAGRNDGGSCKAVGTWKGTHRNALQGEADRERGAQPIPALSKPDLSQS